MAGKTKFPKVLYVHEKDTGNVSYGTTDVAALHEGRVAVYKLAEERECIVSRELVKP